MLNNFHKRQFKIIKNDFLRTMLIGVLSMYSFKNGKMVLVLIIHAYNYEYPMLVSDQHNTEVEQAAAVLQ